MAEKVEDVTFVTFCEMTSLHGWSYIPFRSSSRMSIAFWVITIVSAMFSGVFVISNFTNG